MKIKIIYENYLKGRGLKAAWGFSVIIEFNGKTILFDAGGDEKIFINNFEKSGYKSEDIDFVFISHKHWDHIAGLSFIIKAGAKQIKSKKFKKIMTGLYTTGELKGKVPEQSLIMDTAKGLIVVVGCSHPGIVKIVKFVKQKLKKNIYMILGGFHLYQTKIGEIREIARELKKLGIKRMSPCHCTGKKAIKILTA